MDKFKVGIIGCGGIFRSLHAPYYQEPTRRADIVAIADINETSANEQADQFGADAYTDYRALLDRQDIDAVDVCVHPRPHLEITRAAAAAGKHILMEKPMCCSVEEGEAMISAAEEAGVLLMVAYMMRFDPGHKKLKSLLDDGTLGTLQMAYSNQVGWFSPERHPWLFVKAESGGMLVEQAIHESRYLVVAIRSRLHRLRVHKPCSARRYLSTCRGSCGEQRRADRAFQEWGCRYDD